MKTRFKIKATIYDKKGRVLAVGKNSYVKTHPTMKTLAQKCHLQYKEYLHAEIDAIIKCSKKGGVPYKIFIERYDSFGKPRNAAPCPICCLAIKKVGIKLIAYTV